MGGAVQHPFMLPVPDGLHGLRGMVTGVLRLFDMANGHFVEPIGMAQLLTAEVGVSAGVLRVLSVLDGLTGVLLGIVPDNGRIGPPGDCGTHATALVYFAGLQSTIDPFAAPSATPPPRGAPRRLKAVWSAYDHASTLHAR